MKRMAVVLCAFFLLLCLLGTVVAEENVLTVTPGPGQSGAAPVQEGTYRGTCAPGNSWITFTTGPDAGAEYTLSLENTTPGAGTLYATLYDDFGLEVAPVKFSGTRDNDLVFIQAESNGRRVSGRVDNLEPDTPYFLELKSEDAVDFVLIVKGPVAGTEQAVADPAALRVNADPSADKETAVALTLNQKTFSKLADGVAWFSFTTGPEAERTYSLLLTNMLAEGSDLSCSLYDAGDNKISLGRNGLVAYSNGVTRSFPVSGLEPDTVYYLKLEAADRDSA